MSKHGGFDKIVLNDVLIGSNDFLTRIKKLFLVAH